MAAGERRRVAALGAVGPDELAASLRVTSGGVPDTPPSVDLYGTIFGPPSDADSVLRPLVDRVGTDPVGATRRHTSHPGTRGFWAALGDPDTRPYLRAWSEFFARPLPPEAIESLLRAFTLPRASGESRELDFMPRGGAYNRRDPRATAFVHRDAQFLLKHAVATASPAAAGADGGRPCSTPRERRSTHGAPTGRSRTSPTPTSRTGPPPTTVPTSPG